jgi:prefoldin subunit 5
VQELVKENQQLRDQVRELEKNWSKLEKALGANVRRAKRTVRRRAKSVTRAVNKAIDSATA